MISSAAVAIADDIGMGVRRCWAGTRGGKGAVAAGGPLAGKTAKMVLEKAAICQSGSHRMYSACQAESDGRSCGAPPAAGNYEKGDAHMSSVLVIDDEKATLTMFRLFLKAFGYTVLVAEDGTTGLSIFRAKAPRLVFTDLKMPGIDGFDVLKAMKAAAPETEVIVITGHGDMDLVLRALNLDAADFINKPVSRAALQAALNRAEHRIQNPGARRCRVSYSPLKADAPVVITIDGVLDGSAKNDLRRMTQQGNTDPGRSVIFAFAPHASFNGAGLDLFVRLLADLKERRQPVAICGLCENFRTIMEMIGVPKTLPFAATVSEACSAIAPRTPAP